MPTFEVKGMTCGHCVRAVTKAVKEIDDAAEVRVDLEHGLVDVVSSADAARIGAAIVEAGYEVGATR